MPFLAIVYVPDHTAADRIVERYSRGGAGRIVGLYRWNRKPESCTGCGGKMEAWGRHRHGHLVCGTCNRPHRLARRRLIGAIFDYLGSNLLPRESTPIVFRNPDGWDVSRDD